MKVANLMHFKNKLGCMFILRARQPLSHTWLKSAHYLELHQNKVTLFGGNKKSCPAGALPSELGGVN